MHDMSARTWERVLSFNLVCEAGQELACVNGAVGVYGPVSEFRLDVQLPGVFITTQG